jgi:multidrug efflux system membrane fusion protein
MQPVKVALAQGQLTILDSGVTAGTKVVVDGADRLRQGGQVSVSQTKSAGGGQGKGSGQGSGANQGQGQGAGNAGANPNGQGNGQHHPKEQQ